MNPVRRTVSLTTIPAALAMFLTIAPPISAVATGAGAGAPGPQTLREAGKAAAAARVQSRDAKTREREEDEQEEDADEDDNGVPDRSGLGWTGIGLASAGAAHLTVGLTVARWRNCGPGNRRHCQNLERGYGISGGMLLATGLTFLVIDEVRRHPKPFPPGSAAAAKPSRQTAIAIGPRAIQVRLRF